MVRRVVWYSGSMNDLTKQHCIPCEGTEQPLTREEVEKMMDKVPRWELNSEATELTKEYTCTSFMDAVERINSIAAIAEAEGHHPNLHLTSYKHLRIVLSTHAIGGLSNNDFILAAKISAAMQ